MRLSWKPLGYLAGALWIASLALPAVAVRSEPQQWTRGLTILMLGWIGISQAQLGWYANPLLVPALLISLGALKASRLQGRLLFGALLVCGTSAMLWRQVPCDGSPCDVVGFGSGFYVWLAAVFLGAVLALLRSERDARLNGAV